MLGDFPIRTLWFDYGVGAKYIMRVIYSRKQNTSNCFDEIKFTMQTLQRKLVSMILINLWRSNITDVCRS